MKLIMMCLIVLSASPLVAADFNGDGTADVIWRNAETGATAIWLMQAGKISQTGFPGGVQLTWQIAGLGDVNGDGKDDVLWHHTGGTVAVWLMNGTRVVSVTFPGAAGAGWRMQR